MNRLLLITGDLAAGKSTFAEILSQRYNINVFTKDTIKEVLGDTIGFANREENLKLSHATMELMLFIYTAFAKLNQPLILEANFHRPEMQRFHETAAANQYEVLTLVLRGDIGILHQRYLNRMNNENRHSVHLSTNIDIYEHFRDSVERSRKEEIDGNVIYIDVNDFSYQTDQALLVKIDQFMGRLQAGI